MARAEKLGHHIVTQPQLPAQAHKTTPFGFPVDPDVYNTYATLCGTARLRCNPATAAACVMEVILSKQSTTIVVFPEGI